MAPESFFHGMFVSFFTNAAASYSDWGAVLRQREAMKVQRISPATVARLPIYLQGLEALANAGEELASSERLAEATGIGAPRIRRDLSYLGAFGTPGVGYDVRQLRQVIADCIGLSRVWPVALVGYGTLGSALTAYTGFAERNFQIVAIFDKNPARIGRRVGELVVKPPEEVHATVKQLGIDIAVLATPANSAQEWANLLVSAGVTSLLNLARATITVPHGVAVRHIDLATEIQMLSFHETMKRITVGSLKRSKSNGNSASQGTGESL